MKHSSIYPARGGQAFFNSVVLSFILFTISIYAQTTKNDGDWSLQSAALSNTPEAEFMIRSGDIDNLNYGWAEGFNPFSGRSTDVHDWPYNISPNDASGTDRVMIPTSYIKNPDIAPCLMDGYSSGDHNIYKVFPMQLDLKSIKNANINSAYLLMFVDDFQSPSLCSKFRVWFNGKRFTDVENILNAIDQSGPIGKLIFAKVPGELLPLLKKDKLVISIDDSTTHAGDGFAIDFVKLLINPKPYAYTGNLQVKVINSADSSPIEGANIKVQAFAETNSNSNGYGEISNIPAGLVTVDFSAKGFISKTQSFDVIFENENPEVYEVYLDPLESVTVDIDGKTLMEGEALVLNNIQFKVASAELLSEGKTELNKVADLMKRYPKIEIELSGHTSSEGDAQMNRQLSLRRVESCRKYLSDKGISEDRITTIGYGPDKPIAPNDTEHNRAINRRVELKVVKIK
jgi:outer membrane protein OmpA-like peptidoglycan-associated protein